MADIVLNGKISSQYTNHTYFLKLELTLIQQDLANNRSLVRLRQYAYSTSSTYEAYSASTTGNSYYIKINGVNVVYGTKAMDFRNKATVELGSYEGWVTHNDNGQLTISVNSAFDINGPSSLNDGSVASYNWVLTTIPRYLKITSFSASNITRNTYQLNYSVDKAADWLQYSINGGAWVDAASTILSGSANATYSVKIRLRATDSGLWTESGVITVVMVKTAVANTPSLSSKTCIKISLNWSSSQTSKEVQYKIGSGGWVSAGTFGSETSGAFTIFGLSPGTTYTFYTRVIDEIHGTTSAESAGLSVTTVALSSISSAVAYNIESSQAVSIARPDASLVHDVTLEAYYDGVWNNVPLVSTQSGVATSGTLTPTAAANNTLFAKHPTSKTISIRVKLTVKWSAGGDVQGAVYKTGTGTIVNANPSIASVTYSDTNAAVQTILANNQKILRHKSTLQVVAGAAASQKGATLASYKVTLGGSNYTANAGAGVTSETGKVVSIGTVDQSANQTVVLTVTDSRGNTATKSFTVQMLDYQNPQILQAVPQRLNAYEAPSTMIVEGRRYAVKPVSADVNEVYLRYRLKENPSGTYGAWVTLARTNGSLSGLWQAIAVEQYMADYPNTKSYTVELQISDKFTTWASTFLELSEGIAILRMLKDKMEAGVDLEVINGKGLILESPNGTRYILKINDSGVITTAIA